MPEEPAPPPLSERSTLDQTGSSSPGSFGRYKLLQRLGEGGMGEVWLAEQTEPVHRQVALKVIKAGMDSAQVVVRFEAERQALALMDHPVIATVFDGGTTPEGRPYFAMEYVKGEPISVYCDRHRLSTNERLLLFMQVCEGVQHAHQKGIIHRDLKPSNVLVAIQDERPVPKIIDFGVAKATARHLTERTLFTELGVLIGTPEYMSPEQAEMGSLDIDTRTDIYALGVLLYELLTGSLPFDRKELRQAGLAEIQRIIREKEPARPSTRITQLGPASTEAARNRQTEPRRLASELRGDLDWITMRALEKDRTRRYGSASELVADIKRHMRHEPVLASPPSAGYRLRKFVARHRWGVAVAGLFVVVLAASTAVSTWQAVRATRAERRALVEAQTAERVSAFLSGLFKVSDPSEARGKSVTARELLDRGAAGVESELKDQPELQARLMHTMGRVYESLGLYQQGGLLLERALATRRRLLGNEHPDTLASVHGLGIVRWKQGRYDEAERLYLEAIEARRRVLGEGHVDTLATMNNLAALYVGQGRNQEAEALHEKTLEGRRRTLGDEHPDTLKSMHNLAGVRFGMGRVEEAEALLQEVLKTQRRVLGDDHPETLFCMNSLAIVYLNAERYSMAEPLFLESLDTQRRILGGDHPDTLATMHHLALLYEYQGRSKDAEALFRDTIEAKRRVLGDEHPETLFSLHTLAGLYTRLERYDEAESLYRGTLEARRRTLGGDHADTLFSMQSLADLLRKRGRYDQAKGLYLEVLGARRRLLGAKDPLTAGTLYDLACLHALRGQREEALARLRQAVEAGYSDPEEPRRDPNLESLRGHPEFETILNGIPRGPVRG